jgi:hypothetical protein
MRICRGKNIRAEKGRESGTRANDGPEVGVKKIGGHGEEAGFGWNGNFGCFDAAFDRGREYESDDIVRRQRA